MRVMSETLYIISQQWKYEEGKKKKEKNREEIKCKIIYIYQYTLIQIHTKHGKMGVMK